ncbi:helix-turn-helix transcriptional regulator [Alloscardovia theropitheci]|nr:AraC family transcriptional regulator [Alloscardovia theropitheci]
MKYKDGSLPQLPTLDIKRIDSQKIDDIKLYVDFINIGDNDIRISRTRAQNAVHASFKNLTRVVGDIDSSENFAILTHRPEHVSHLHYHDHFELTYVSDGSMLLITENNTYVLEEGDCILVPPNTAHALAPIENEGHYPLEIDFLIKNEFLEAIKSLNIYEEITPLHDSTECLLIEEPSFAHQLDRIITTYSACSYHVNFSVLGAILSAFHSYNIIMNQHQTIPALQTRINTIIEHNLTDVTIPHIASELGYSIGYLSRKVKKEIGTTVGKMIIDARLDAAQDYLSRTSYSIERIAELIGYDSVSYLYKIFYERFHQTPAQYRSLFAIDHEAATLLEENH